MHILILHLVEFIKGQQIVSPSKQLDCIRIQFIDISPVIGNSIVNIPLTSWAAQGHTRVPSLGLKHNQYTTQIC